MNKNFEGKKYWVNWGGGGGEIYDICKGKGPKFGPKLSVEKSLIHGHCIMRHVNSNLPYIAKEIW